MILFLKYVVFDDFQEGALVSCLVFSFVYIINWSSCLVGLGTLLLIRIKLYVGHINAICHNDVDDKILIEFEWFDCWEFAVPVWLDKERFEVPCYKTENQYWNKYSMIQTWFHYNLDVIYTYKAKNTFRI